MRLTHIKLAGFKSFVDPTHISVPGDLVGVVGPNGCGKSNIIDAVRWVLGESKASALRGESLQDVIFSGSGSRKPVGRASVELGFDNSLGKAAGQWSEYAEISIKRVLEREGESSYYINNLHVRRRDIQDIFLGTGVGGRGYAIIEQGMISRIIEAKPEELRTFLEEAAGVSKYRERRRETELRLEDTRENLIRVNDIRQELEGQLVKLEEQAKVAARYRDLQQELVTAQSLLWLIRKQDAGNQRARLEKEVQRLETEMEGETAKLREAEKRLEEQRTRHFGASDAVHEAQGELYAANAEVSRLEQKIDYMRQSRQRLETQIQAAEQQRALYVKQVENTEGALSHWRGELDKARARQEAAKQAADRESDGLPVAEQAFRNAQERVNGTRRELLLAEQAGQLEETHRSHALKSLEQLNGRRGRLLEEQGALAQPDLPQLEALKRDLAECGRVIQETTQSLEEINAGLPDAEAQKRDLAQAVQAVEQQLTEVEARIAALQALQEKLEANEQLTAWLARQGLERLPRLWQGIRIERGWEDALEAVLRERLNGVNLGRLDGTGAWAGDLPPGKLTVYELEGDAAAADAGNGRMPLMRYVTCRDSRVGAVLNEWLARVYVAEDDSMALASRSGLAPGEALVTRGGHVYTRHSVSYHAADSQLHGVLARQREIEELKTDAATRRLALEQGRQRLAEAEERQRRQEAEAARLGEEAAARRQRQHDLELEILKLTQLADRTRERAEQIARELTEIEEQGAAESRRRDEAEARLRECEARIQDLRQQVEAAATAAREAESRLAGQREVVQNASRNLQEVMFFEKTCAAKLQELDGVILSVQDHIRQVDESLQSLRAEHAGFDETAVREDLGAALNLRQVREQALAERRNAMEEAAAALREIEQERMAAEQKLDPLRTRVQEIRLKEQEARINEAQYEEQLQNAHANQEELARLLGKGVRASHLQNDMNRLNEEITALGAVNLAALEELETTRERKGYLDAQSQDLTEAVETLENAIRRIDRETRERLLETFEQVNRHLSEMFPTLFGGGQARLVLTGDEILDSGVQVIAQPPGKKNTSIHLLSGGEKALTALALVFSMFQLNPAPFCLLDEVDAPLDDTNTERFCDLVRKMTQQTQFLFISHNKITMEMAHQLIGITMQEQGVSRVVAVDIEEAIRLRDQAAA
ncbi:MAG: chromosome segregation protein SMC [Betaproteobacteria bacterium]|nr:chromosome segregation protein SMC [Betaproteobacteria bacterium]